MTNQPNPDELREQILDALEKVYNESHNLGEAADEILAIHKAGLTKQLQELRERLPEPISDWKGGLLWKSQDATAGMIYGHHLALLEVIKLIEEMEK